MSKILIIPDVHLNMDIFDSAEILAQKQNIDTFVFLGDLVDTHGVKPSELSYKNVIARAINFKETHPKTYFCWGNHDLSYVDPVCRCSEFQKAYAKRVSGWLEQYKEKCNPQVMHLIDGVLFSHAGLCEWVFMIYNHNGRTTQDIVDAINKEKFGGLMHDFSPIWYRPDYNYAYHLSDEIKAQFIGHSPVEKVAYIKGAWLMDTFGRAFDGTILGDKTLSILDTETLALSVYNTESYSLVKTVPNCTDVDSISAYMEDICGGL